MDIIPYQAAHFAGVKALWAEAFAGHPPWDQPEFAIHLKLTVQPELFLVALDGARVTGTALAGFDGHRGWLHSVAVVSSHRRRGIARALIKEAERGLDARGCPKVNVQVPPGNPAAVALYQALGYDPEHRVSMGRPIGRFGRQGAGPDAPAARGEAHAPAAYTIASYRASDFAGVKALWDETNPDARPWNTPEVAVAMKLTVQPELFLVARERAAVVGTTIAGFDGCRGWLHAVAVPASHRRRGIAQALIREAERRLVSLGCPKLNLQVIAGNRGAIALYETLGFAVEERASLSRRIGRFQGLAVR